MSITDPSHVIGIDLGGTNMLLSVVGADGVIVARAHTETEADRGYDHVIDKLVEGIGEVCREAGMTLDEIAAVGVAVAGAVDVRTGIVLKAQNLGWEDKPMRDMLERRLSRPVVIENDVNAAIWGEYARGAGRERGDCFGVWVGTGIGGGLVLNGKLYHGEFSTAGEFGMSVSQPDGEPGFRTVEDHASRTGMRRRLASDLPNHPDSKLFELSGGDAEQIGTNELASAYEAEDALACRVIERGAYLLGIAIANFVTMLSVDTVIVGGGITEALGERYLEKVREQFRADVFPARCRDCEIIMTTLEADAGVLGAALLALEAAA